MIPTSSIEAQGSDDTPEDVQGSPTPQPRMTPPLTRERARLLGQVVLSKALFEVNPELPMVTMLRAHGLDNGHGLGLANDDAGLGLAHEPGPKSVYAEREDSSATL